jgi:hypothetical protein
MFIAGPILRAPKQSEMALSNQVKESIIGATNCLRDALAFAARAEHPITINTISDILMRLESLEHIEDMMEKFHKAHEGNRHFN